MAFYLIDPWGDQRADMRAALISSTAGCNLLRSGPPILPSELMLFPGGEESRCGTDNPVEIEAYFAALANAFGS